MTPSLPPPPPPGKKHFHYCLDGTNVLGPLSGDELLKEVTESRLLRTVQVCEVGSEQWVEFSTLPNSSFTPLGHDYLNKTLPVLQKKANDELNTTVATEIGKNPFVGVGCAVLLGAIALILLKAFGVF